MPALYHMTHLRNLPGILAEGGLWCDHKAALHGHCQQSIAYAHIKNRRAARTVLSGNGGTLADYVPFYFATRQPMLYAIKAGRVNGYTDGQEQIVYLRLSTESVATCGRSFAFSNGHAEMALAEFSSDLAQLEALIDRPLMSATYWQDTPEDPNRKFRRQAEFLIHDFVSWDLIEEIGVYSDPLGEQVRALCAGHPHLPTISVKREWYFP